ncbi:hypothetical protein EC957_001485, partial [Mortierella hygrophila]
VRSPIEEPNLVANSLERKRRRLAAEGYDTAVIDIMTRLETQLCKQSCYNYVQEMYLKWCHDNELDPYIANPSNILALFDDKIPFENNDTFTQFFKVLRANEPDTSTEVDLDLSPIITYLRSFTSNEEMSAEELTQKL